MRSNLIMALGGTLVQQRKISWLIECMSLEECRCS